jgi:beta-phosphoglucomutase-like phosphatase (HAD superfamily)
VKLLNERESVCCLVIPKLHLHPLNLAIDRFVLHSVQFNLQDQNHKHKHYQRDLRIPNRNHACRSFSFPLSYSPRSSPFLNSELMPSQQLDTLLLDCDNCLVFSESLAFEACAELANEILATHNISDRYTGPQLMTDFVGQNFRGMMVSLNTKYKLDMSDAQLQGYVTKEEDKVIAKLKEKLQPCPGVNDQLEKVAKQGKYKMVVVSSSAKRRVWASLVKAGQDKYLPEDGIYSAATSLPKPTSKPDPAIYLYAMEQLGKKPEQCIAVEDSKSGATSANRAGLRVVGYVGSYEEHEREKMRKVLEDAGATTIMYNWDEFEFIIERVEKGKL